VFLILKRNLFLFFLFIYCSKNIYATKLNDTLEFKSCSKILPQNSKNRLYVKIYHKRWQKFTFYKLYFVTNYKMDDFVLSNYEFQYVEINPTQNMNLIDIKDSSFITMEHSFSKIMQNFSTHRPRKYIEEDSLFLANRTNFKYRIKGIKSENIIFQFNSEIFRYIDLEKLKMVNSSFIIYFPFSINGINKTGTLILNSSEFYELVSKFKNN